MSVKQFHRHPEDTELYTESTYYEYSEFISKNNQHRFKDIHAKNKVVKAYSNTSSTKCIVKNLDAYFSRIPPNSKAFYLRPSTHDPVKHSVKAWFFDVPVGVNTLNAAVASMAKKAGLRIRYTNHSLRATSASRLYAKNVPEKLIAEKTGHRSLAGLRAYERTTTIQEKSMSRMLEDPLSSFVDPEQKSSAAGSSTEQKCSSDQPTKLPMITGTLNNCVFNFYQN